MVQTPSLRCEGESKATAFAAPRSLYALIGCRFSSLTRTSIPGIPSRASSGVRTMVPAMRSRAARMSAISIGRTGSSVFIVSLLRHPSQLGVADFALHDGHHHGDVFDR